MATTMVQAIAGVNTRVETEVMTVYPSIGSKALGRFLGSLYDSIPLGNFPVKLSHLLFPLPTSPLAAIGYFDLKLRGVRYKLTNRSLQVWQSLGNRMREQIPLTDVGDVAIRQRPGQAFFKCADLQILGKDGKPIATLDGVPRAEVFRHTILKARDSAAQVKSSLATIEARHKA